MTRWTPARMPDQSGRVALVTGANSGLGLHVGLELARRGASVLLACRSRPRGEAALARIRREVPAAQAELLLLDLADLASVRSAAAQVRARTPRLDLLVANAGVMAIPRQVTVDGFELQLATNHLGHVLLTGLLLPALLAAPSPRVVVVSSLAHRSGMIGLHDLAAEHGYSRWGAYAQSKLANLLFAAELHRRSRGRLLVASAHPGLAATGLYGRKGNLLLEAGLRAALLVAQSAAAGAWPVLYAATMPDVEGDDYLGPGLLELRGRPRRVGRSPAARDEVMAGLLWEACLELTGASYAALD